MVFAVVDVALDEWLFLAHHSIKHFSMRMMTIVMIIMLLLGQCLVTVDLWYSRNLPVSTVPGNL